MSTDALSVVRLAHERAKQTAAEAQKVAQQTCCLGGVLVASVHSDDRQVRSRRSDVLPDSQPSHRSD